MGRFCQGFCTVFLAVGGCAHGPARAAPGVMMKQSAPRDAGTVSDADDAGETADAGNTPRDTAEPGRVSAATAAILGQVSAAYPVPADNILEGRGFLDRAQIRDVVHANVGQVRRCYVDAGATPEGRILVRWVISRQGRVSSIRLESYANGLGSAAECIVRHIARWRFPSPRGGTVVVRYPFDLRSE